MTLKLADIPLIPARHFTPAQRTKCDLIVIHTTENRQRLGLARDVALWFAGATAPQASAHFVVDNREVFECVHPNDVAWAAPGANAKSLHIEHCGQASMTVADWAGEYSKEMLALSAQLAAALCVRWLIPPTFVGVKGLRAGERGITTHLAVSDAFRKSTHIDPGAAFPLDDYIRQVERLACTVDR